MKYNYKVLLFSILALLIIQPKVFAIVESNGAGAIQSELQKEFIDENINKNIFETPHSPNTKDKKTFEQIQKEDVPNTPFDPAFKLNKINFSGNKVYKTTDLENFVSPIIGQEVHIKDIENIAEIITKKYHYDGYITSYAFIPEQDVIDGVITIKIIESKVKDINIEGNRWTRKAFFKYNLFTPSGLQEDKVFKLSSVDSVMANINKLDYLKTSFSISRDDETEDTIITAQVKDRFPIKFNTTWDNHGRYYTGEQRARMTLSNENLTGLGDKIYGGVILARNTQGVLAGYQVPISPWGTKLAFDYGYTNVKMGHDLKPFDITGKSTSYLLRLIQPFYKSPSTEIEGSVGIDFQNTNSHIGQIQTSDYSLRVLRAAIYGTHDDKFGRSFASVNGDFGFNGMGAKGNGVSGAPDTCFQKYSANIIRLQKIPVKSSYLVMRVGGQYAPDPLYPSEQLQLGGYSSVRGYETGALLGDYGVNGSIELRTPIPGLKSILPNKYKSISDNIKLITFYDFGYFGAHQNPYNYNTDFIHSVGTGLNIFFKNGIALNMAVGIPLCAKDYQRGSARLHFAISSDIDRLIYRKFENETL